jgi:hypothetical protein
MIKVEEVKGKLENKYRRRYFIKSVNEFNNYTLVNSKGIELEQKYSGNKSKPIREYNTNK